MTPKERRQINNYLGNRGLATLDDPRGLIEQIAFLIEDEPSFRRLLSKCTPENRRDMYETLRPRLSFPIKPLDIYIAEFGMEAEIEQLPTVDSDGRFQPFHQAEIHTQKALQTLVENTLAKVHLTLTCKKCTRTQTFPAGRRVDAIQFARDAGWTYGLDPKGEGYEICPDCPVSKN